MFKIRVLFFAMIAFSIGTYDGLAQELKIASLNYPPFQYTEGGTTKGIAADIVKEIFKRLKRPIRISFYPFPRAVKNIKTGASDAIFTFYHKKEREAFVLYAKEPLVDQTIALFVHKDSPIRFDGDLSALNKYKFGLVRFSYGKIFDEAVKNKTITLLEYVSKMESNMKKFLSRRFDILPSDRWVAYYYYAQSNLRNTKGIEIKELTPAIQAFPAYIGFSKANQLETLRDQVDKTLKEMKQDGTYAQIITSYLASWGVADLKPAAGR